MTNKRLKRKIHRNSRPGAPWCALVLLLSGVPSILAVMKELSDPGQAITFEMLAAPAPAGTLADRRGAAAAAASKPPGLAGTDAPPPDTYPVQGIIDPLSEHNSGEPGVLVPLAQAASSVDHWMEAVDAAGPATPFSDPSFEGTVFIPDDVAFEAAYPRLRQAAALRRNSSSINEVFTGLKQAQLAAQLNSLTVPGAVLKLQQLAPGNVLTTAEGGSLKVLGVRPNDGTARLQHLQTGAIFSVVEPDLQSGQAVGHIVDSLLSPAQASSIAAEQGTLEGPGGRYASAMSVLQDPVHQLLGFAGLIEQAGLTAELATAEAEQTLFVPSNEALRAFLSHLTVNAQQALLSNSSLADQVVSGHLVSGVSLGSKALMALAEGQMVRTQAGSLMHVQQLSGGGAAAPAAATAAAAAASAAADVSTPRLVAEQGQQQAIRLLTAPLLTVDGALITTPDLIGGKAVVHVINKVLIPPETAAELGTEPTSSGPGSLRVHSKTASAAAHPVCATAMQLAGVAVAAVALSTLV